MWIKYKLDSRYTNALSYDDVFIVPQYSDISSRKEVDISTTINGKPVSVPIMNANMESVADEYLCGELKNAGGISALHRFQSIGSACKEYQNVAHGTAGPVFVSVGVNRDSKERAQELYNTGAREFIIDIAHGDSKQMCDMITWMKSNLPNCYILAGNVATGDAVEHLANWGADAVKIQVGPGLVCVTKSVTGVTMPTFTCLQSCYNGKTNFEYRNKHIKNKKVALCADGGIREIGDICKALAFTDFVMSGKMFAGCIGAPGKGTYRGSASSEVQTMYRTDKEYVPTPEGKSIIVDATGETVGQVVEHIAGGIRSACSYVGARNLLEFKNKCTFGTRHNKS